MGGKITSKAQVLRACAPLNSDVPACFVFIKQSLGYIIKLMMLEALSNSYFMLYLLDLFLP